MSANLKLPLAAIDLLAIQIKDWVAADAALEGYRVKVERVPDLEGAVGLVQGNILVAPTRLGDEPSTSKCHQHRAGIGILLPFIQDSTILGDEEAGPGTLFNTVVNMVEDWNKTVTLPATATLTDDVVWHFKGAGAGFFGRPEVSGANRKTGRTTVVLLVELSYERTRHEGKP